MGHHKQFSFEKIHWKFRYSHGGILRKQRKGRGSRPLSTKDTVHLVFKADKKNLRRGFRSPLGFKISQEVIRKYAKKFFVKIEQQAICSDHIHLLVRLGKRSHGQHFFRVVAGQIAQQFKNGGFNVTDTRSIWKYRPFTRVLKGWKAFWTAKNYLRLNEKEASGIFRYKKERLKGLSLSEWELLWF